MQAVMLIAESPDLLPDFKTTLQSAFPVALLTDIGDRPGFVVELSISSRIWVEFGGEDLAAVGWEDFEIDLITQKFNSNHYVYSIAYHSIEAVKKAIVSLADSDQVMVDNDSGDLMIGSEMVDRIRREPTWNWLKDFGSEDE